MTLTLRNKWGLRIYSQQCVLEYGGDVFDVDNLDWTNPQGAYLKAILPGVLVSISWKSIEKVVPYK